MKIKRPFIDLFLIIPFILYGQYIYSQDYILEPATSFEKLELPGGSLGNSVQCMVQDSFGFMWYASKNGLHRWDGYQFKTYQHDPDDSTSISGNHVEHICLAKDGTLWIAVGWGTNKGLLEHFDQRTETFTHYDYQPELKINSEAYNLATIIEDHDGDIWTGTHYGVYKLDIKNGTFKQYLHDPDDSTSISHNITRSIFKDSKGVLWFGTGLFWDQSPDGGLNRYRPETDDFVRYYHDPNDVNSLKSNIISALSEDSNGNFWVGTTHGGLHKMNREMGTFQRITEPVFSSFKSSITISKAISNTFIQYIYEDLKKQLWVGYFNGGLLNYNPVTGTKQLFEADKSKPGSLPEKYLWSIYGSRDGTLWGSTTGPESVVYKIKQSDFNSYKLASSTNFVGALCESQDQSIWVGTHEEGLSKLDLKASKVIPIELKTIRSSNSTKVYDSQLVDKNEILKKPIKIVEENAGGGLWIIKDLYPGMIYFNPQNNVAKTYGYDPNDKKSISEGIFTDILKDDQGDVWFVSSTGDLNVYDNETDGFSKFKYSSSVEEEVGLNYNCQLTNSSNGRIIIAGTGANPGQLPILLKYFNPETKEFIEVDISLANSELDLIDREITGLIEDRNGNIWICNHSHLININPSSGDVNILSAKIFNTDYFKGMAMDDHGRIWMVGENISFFDPLSTELSIRSVSSNTVKNFPGFKQTIINSSDGLIYIGGEGSFICFSPDRILSNKSNIPPQSIISDFQLLDQADDNQNSTNFKLYLNENISLNHHQNTFSIRFATLDFNNPQQNRIRYKLDGLDDQWRTAGLDPVATYIKIPPGDYTFQVKGATAFSEWGSSQEMGIQISPPLWATWWAYTLYGILILGFLYLLNKFQLKRKLEKSETVRLKEIDIAKNRLFTNISHEFRTPLTVISGMSSHIKENPEKWLDEGTTIIDRNCKRLLDLVNQMLDLSKLESGKLVLHQVQSDIIPFVKYISESFNSLAEEAEIELTVYPEIEELYMDFDPQKLSTIVMNLISNAIKFTLPGGKIIIHLNAIEKNGKDLFIIKVKDNGTGISADELNNIFNRFHQVDNSSTRVVEGTGIGLALTRELTELMGGSIDVKSVLSKGSEFIVQLPVFRNESISNDLIISHKIPKTNNYITPVEWVEKMDLPLVLIIEDNEDVANYLKASLEEKYNLIYARDGDEGIQKAYERIPDVIISDVMMPGKDGYEVCSTLKNDERTDHIPIILLTAKASLQDKISGISYGADAYLIKPFNKAELFNRVEQLMLLREKMLKKVQQDSYSLLLKKQVKGTEAGFLKKAVDQVHLHINDHSFGSAQLAHKLHLSESQVYRKLKAITGKSTAIFIRSVRLQQAKELILNGDDPISSIAYDVGFNDPSWFSRAFKEEFGYAPSDLHK